MIKFEDYEVESLGKLVDKTFDVFLSSGSQYIYVVVHNKNDNLLMYINGKSFEVIDITEQGIFVLHEDSNITFRLRVNRNDLSVYLKLNAGNVSYFIMIYPLVNKEFDYDRYLIHLDLINKINNL
jgi:hypothetical protein